MGEKKSDRSQTMRERTSVKTMPSSESSEQKKAKVRKNVAVFVALSLLLICVFAALSLTVFFNIENIEVGEFSYYTKSEIRDACGIQKGENLFLLSADDVQKSLRASLPYVGTVKIKRKLPSTVQIVIEPAKAVYAFQDLYGSYTLTESSYRVLEKYAPKTPQDCIVVKGAQVSEESKLCKQIQMNAKTQTALETVLNTLKNYEFKKITSVDLSDESDLQIVYEDRIILKVGSQANLDYKIKCAKKTLEERYQDPQIQGVLDLSLLTGDGKNLYFRERDIHASSSQSNPDELLTQDDTDAASSAVSSVPQDSVAQQ